MTDRIATERVANFYGFMEARERIRLKRLTGAPPPWTDDAILSTYKFTNVKREHDRTTRELVERHYRPHRDAPKSEKLYNAALFRYFGTIEWADHVGWQTKHRGSWLIEQARKRLDAGERVFTGAYVITNQGISAPKEQVVADNFLEAVWVRRISIANVISNTNCWQAAARELGQISGFGGTGFMTKEVLLDVILAGGFDEGGPSDRNTWCPAGPGARRGLCRLLGIPTKTAMGEKRALALMLDLFSRAKEAWPWNFVTLELHDIQFQLCEFDKYERTRLGEGRPRSRYSYAKSPK